MTILLRIDVSPRPATQPGSGLEGSFSRDLADVVEARIARRHNDLTVLRRDLAAEALPHIGDLTIKGYYTSPNAMTAELRAATALSDRLISEIEAADLLLLSVPMYNFSFPSAFKAWIDQIVRINRTFSYENGAFRGLMSGKTAYFCHAFGANGYLDGGAFAAYDHMSPYLRMILGFIGITDVTSFAIEATTADAATIAAKRGRALARIEAHFAA